MPPISNRAPLPLTPLQKHLTEWSSCKRCSLAKTRKKVVLARGTVPAEVLFIGEAPGQSEDVIGVPFVGPPGKLLDSIISESQQLVGREFRYAMTNVLACIPKGSKPGELPKTCVEDCMPRLREFIELVKPLVIVMVGDSAQRYVPLDYPCVFTHVRHPGLILRLNYTLQSLVAQRCAIAIKDAIEEAEYANSQKAPGTRGSFERKKSHFTEGETFPF